MENQWKRMPRLGSYSKRLIIRVCRQRLKHSRFVSLQVGQDLSHTLQRLTTLAQWYPSYL
eukprot:9486802-Ditylum_brightwellii.AAC.1